ncbi:MAG: hypothetical protein KDD40_01835 [Bdellovibrionales bacterium]|nr:hypothetical protein [Bdellovibrionales bacterium]
MKCKKIILSIFIFGIIACNKSSNGSMITDKNDDSTKYELVVEGGWTINNKDMMFNIQKSLEENPNYLLTLIVQEGDNCYQKSIVITQKSIETLDSESFWQSKYAFFEYKDLQVRTGHCAIANKVIAITSEQIQKISLQQDGLINKFAIDLGELPVDSDLDTIARVHRSYDILVGDNKQVSGVLPVIDYSEKTVSYLAVPVIIFNQSQYAQNIQANNFKSIKIASYFPEGDVFGKDSSLLRCLSFSYRNGVYSQIYNYQEFMWMILKLQQQKKYTQVDNILVRDEICRKYLN